MPEQIKIKKYSEEGIEEIEKGRAVVGKLSEADYRVKDSEEVAVNVTDDEDVAAKLKRQNNFYTKLVNKKGSGAIGIEQDQGFEIDSVKLLAYYENSQRKRLAAAGTNAIDVASIADEFIDLKIEAMAAKMEALRDSLTKTFNKNAFLEQGPKILAMEFRNNANVVVLMMDLDFFKKVNDEHGHVVGDMALQTLAHTVNSKLRNSDFLYRYGGEEFAVILTNTTTEDAYIRAEKIRKAVSEAVIKKSATENINITISIGMCSVSDLSVTDLINKIQDDDVGDGSIKKDEMDKLILAEIVSRADSALYEAKSAGRNNTIIYSKDR